MNMDNKQETTQPVPSQNDPPDKVRNDNSMKSNHTINKSVFDASLIVDNSYIEERDSTSHLARTAGFGQAQPQHLVKDVDEFEDFDVEQIRRATKDMNKSVTNKLDMGGLGISKSELLDVSGSSA